VELESVRYIYVSRVLPIDDFLILVRDQMLVSIGRENRVLSCVNVYKDAKVLYPQRGFRHHRH